MAQQHDEGSGTPERRTPPDAAAGATLAGRLTFSDHARDRMAERGISEEEVTDALAHVASTTTARASSRIQDLLTPSESLERLDRTGETRTGRHLRITHPKSRPNHVISVVELTEEPP